MGFVTGIGPRGGTVIGAAIVLSGEYSASDSALTVASPLNVLAGE